MKDTQKLTAEEHQSAGTVLRHTATTASPTSTALGRTGPDALGSLTSSKTRKPEDIGHTRHLFKRSMEQD